MFDLLGIIAILFTAKEIVDEKIEPVASKDICFDWSAYWNDVKNGMTSMEQIKKREHGGYTTIKSISKDNISINEVIDIKRYQYDKEVYGEAIAEIWRKNGSYKYIKDIE